MRVLVVEDQGLLRSGLISLFADAGHDAVGRSDATDVVDHVADVDLVVMDVRMPPTFTDEGTRAAAALKATRPDLGVLVLSSHVETGHLLDLVAERGFGYLLKDRVLDGPDFLASAERVAAGGSAIDPMVVRTLMASHPRDALTEREQEVLSLMAEGLSNAGIGRRMVLSERTVETHINNIFTKLALPPEPDTNRRVRAVLAHLR